MRNFKKFLALVLAMLMVSACAVSVSAFDDVTKDDYYANAVDLLATLGVISGRNDGTDNFYPNDTLTREEAAVIAAKTIAGAKVIDWNESTTRFTDVVDEWSFAYINYVDAENVMVGNGTDTFDPKDELQIDEAIKIALAIAYPADALKAYVEMNKNPSLDWWVHYVDAADSKRLTANVPPIRNYQAECTRGMFAQFIANAINDDATMLQDNFGFDYAEGNVTVNSDATVVTIDGQKISATLFNEALKAAGYEETAADLAARNSKAYISWFKKGADLEIVNIVVLTTGDVTKYNSTEIKVENVYDCLDNDGKYDDLNKKYIKINGVKYEVGAVDGSDENEVLGGADVETVGITVTIDTVPVAKYDTTNDETKAATGLNTLPKYFEAFLYDDNGDGDYERCDIVEYVIATIAKDAATAANGYKQDLYTVNFKNGMDSRRVNVHTGDSAKAAKFSGETFTADNEWPVLVAKKWNTGDTVDVLEIATPVTGQLTSLIPGTPNAVVIGGTTYKYVAGAFNTPDANSLKQTITIYTINNELVNVTGASFVAKTIVVDKATIDEAGNVVLTGFDGEKFNSVEYVLTGAEKGGKYVAAAGHYVETAANKDYVKPVALGGTKTGGVWSGEYATFAEGVFYKVVVTTDGVYYVKDTTVEAKNLDNFFNITLADSQKFAVAADYIKIADVSMYHNNSALVITRVADATLANNEYYVTYNVGTSFDAATGVVAKTNSVASDKVALVYITNKGTPVVNTTKVEKLADGQTIVQILKSNFIAADFDYYTFEAFDLIAGKKVSVKCASDNLVAGKFYVAEGDVISDTKVTGWVVPKTITATTSGVVTKYSAFPIYYNKTGDTIEFGYASEATEYGAAQIKIYDANDTTGVIEFNTDGSVKTITVANAFVEGSNVFYKAYVVKDQIIIVK